MKHQYPLVLLALVLVVPALTGAQPTGMHKSAKSTLTYTHDVKPILDQNCISCHHGSSPPKGLNLTTYAGVMHGLTGGVKVVKAGHPATSLLVKVLHGSPVQMPPSGAIASSKISKIETWIRQGAKKGT